MRSPLQRRRLDQPTRVVDTGAGNSGGGGAGDDDARRSGDLCAGGGAVAHTDDCGEPREPGRHLDGQDVAVADGRRLHHIQGHRNQQKQAKVLLLLLLLQLHSANCKSVICKIDLQNFNLQNLFPTFLSSRFWFFFV